VHVGEFFSYGPKSTLKAGDAVIDGKYRFFTSSNDEDKRCCEYQFEGEGIIMGTGGNATLHYCNDKFSVSTDCVVILPSEKIKCKYLYYFFLANIAILEAGFKGAGLKHTSKNYISNIELNNIPSLVEQEKIIAILDMANQVVHNLREEITTLDTLIKARFVEMFGDTKSNPLGFEKRPLAETCTVITGNTPSRSVPEYYGNSIEWIKTDNIITGQLYPSQALEYLSDEGVKVGRTVEKGAILMACIAGSVASIGKVCITDRRVAFNQQINAVVPQKYDSLFLHTMFQLSKEYLVEDLNMALKGILSKSKLESKEFIVPPMKQQKKFAAYVTQVDKSKFVFPNFQFSYYYMSSRNRGNHK